MNKLNDCILVVEDEFLIADLFTCESQGLPQGRFRILWTRPRPAREPRAFYKRRDDGVMPLICPTCQKVFRGIGHASDRQATLHGVVFDILDARPCESSAKAGTHNHRC